MGGERAAIPCCPFILQPGEIINSFKSFRWAGLLLIVGAVCVVLVPPLERYYNTEDGLAGFFFSAWFLCFTLGMVGLSFYYGAKGSGRAGWLNFLGLILLYTFWVMSFADGNGGKIAWIGIGLAYITIAAAAHISKQIPRWVLVVWALAALSTSMISTLENYPIFDYFINWWNMGLGFASFGTGLAVWRTHQEGESVPNANTEGTDE